MMIWQAQENTRLDAAARVGAFGRLQRVTKLRDLDRTESRHSKRGMTWRVGESPRDGIRNLC